MTRPPPPLSASDNLALTLWTIRHLLLPKLGNVILDIIRLRGMFYVNSIALDQIGAGPDITLTERNSGR